MIIDRIAFASSLLWLTLAGGCSAYIEGFHYAPHPAVADIQVSTTTTQPSQGVQAPLTIYATVIGVRRADRDQHIPLSVEVRLQIDHRGPQPVNFDPNTLDLTNGDLVRFPPPIVQPPQGFSVTPGQPVIVEANFPFPPGMQLEDGGMETLQLHWAVQMDGHVIPQSVSFHRVHHPHYDPYWGYPPPYPYPYGYPYSYWGPDVAFGGAVIIRR